MIFCDQTEIKNAFYNIVINALQAMEHCSIGNLIIMTTDSIIDNKPYVVVTFSDTGCGINESVQLRIFEPGFSTKQGSGHGLGLFGVREAIAKFGGTISVHSVPDHGSTFTLRIPAVVKNNSADLTL
jgi:signal transduction histidine kinase